MNAEWRLRRLAVPLAGAAGCLVLAGCASSPEQRVNNMLEGFANDPCTMMSEHRQHVLRLKQLGTDSAEPRTCTWSYTAGDPHYLLRFEANPSRERQRHYTDGLNPTKITVEGRAVTQVMKPVTDMASCANIVNFDEDHGFIVHIIDADPSDACGAATRFTTSIILTVQDSE